MDLAGEVLTESLQHGVSDVDSLKMTYHRLTVKKEDFTDIELKSSIPELPEYSISLSEYNELIYKKVYDEKQD